MRGREKGRMVRRIQGRGLREVAEGEAEGN